MLKSPGLNPELEYPINAEVTWANLLGLSHSKDFEMKNSMLRSMAAATTTSALIFKYFV